jgi:hypothetical protein
VKHVAVQQYSEQVVTGNRPYSIPPCSTGLAGPRWVPTQAVRPTVAPQLEALRSSIAKMSVSPGRIPALG